MLNVKKIKMGVIKNIGLKQTDNNLQLLRYKFFCILNKIDLFVETV